MWNSLITAIVAKLVKMLIEFILDQIDIGGEMKVEQEAIKDATISKDTSVIEHVLNK